MGTPRAAPEELPNLDILRSLAVMLVLADHAMELVGIKTGRSFHPTDYALGRIGVILFFVHTSFVLMANVRYGMNLRYTNMWDFPLRYLAVYCLWQLIPRKNAQALWMSICIAALCTIDLRQYHIFFVQNDVYELVPKDLLRAVKMPK